MDNDLQIRIRSSADTTGIKDADRALDGLGATGGKQISTMERLNRSVGAITGVTAVAGASVYGLTSFMGSSVTEANSLNGALTGLNSVARAFGQDAGVAKNAAKELASDGLMTVTDAASGLKNLLAAGFSLPEAVTLMNRFKDSAAFGKQGALSFGEAIRGATEGIKNGNSILVDNAGVTKNLSMMLTDAGYSAQDLMKASTDAGVRQAIFNGILKETNPQLGDAAKLSDSAAGAQARLAAQTQAAKAQLGSAVNEALLPLINVITPIIQRIGQWINENQRLAAGIAIAMVAFLAIIAVIGSLLVVVAAIGAVFGAVSAGIVVAVVAAAAAVGAGIAYMIMNWQRVRDFVAQAVAAINARVSLMIGLFGSIAGIIGSVAGGIYNAIVSPYVRAYNTITGIVSKIGGAFSGIKNFASGLRGKIPGFATGTSFAPGGMALVGERGPELVNLPRGSQVYTNSQSQGMMGGGGAVSNTYNIAKIELSTGDAVKQFMEFSDRNGVLVSKGLSMVRV